MKEYIIDISFLDGTMGYEDIYLVVNDYNSTKFNFTYDMAADRYLLKIKYPDSTVAYVDEINNNEYILQPGLLSQEGYYGLEVSAYTNDGRLTGFATMDFFVRNELVSTDDIVEPDDRVPILDRLINEVDNLNLVADKSGRITTITITKKDGTTQEVTLEDGKSIEYNWQGTSLGIRQEGQSEYQYVNLKGDKGDAGAIKMIIVNELPATGSDDTIYLVPNDDPETENNYDEYVYVNNAWEKLCGRQVEVDLTDYVKNNDYATSSKGGVVKSGYYGLQVYSDSGKVYCDTYTYSTYGGIENQRFISKGTLENVITGKDLTTKAYVDGLVGDINTILATLTTPGGNG